MENSKEASDPKYLKDLMQLTPSGIAKLFAAWSNLSTETQIFILSWLDETPAPAYLAQEVRINALDSENAYVRYLAARKLHFSNDCTDEEKIIKAIIEDDPVPLVKYCLLESKHAISWRGVDTSWGDADEFFALPHEARLAKIRNVEGNGETIAKLFSQAVDKHLKEGTVSEFELYELLADYLVKPEFRDEYAHAKRDGWSSYTDTRDVESLWRLVPKLPEGISYILIQNLPEGAADIGGLHGEIPREVTNSMTDRQLETLLYREDIEAEKLRKMLYWKTDVNKNVKVAASTINFQVSYDEFEKILAKPPEERVKTLSDLGMMANELSLCIYAAIDDALSASTVNSYDYENAHFARNALKRRINNLKEWQKKEELTELRLYRLARRAVPWDEEEEGYGPGGELEFLSENIVPGDTWATFVAFSKAWPKKVNEAEYLGGFSREGYRMKELYKCLPRIDEIDEEYINEDPEIEPIDEANSKRLEAIQVKFKDLEATQNKLRWVPNQVTDLTREQYNQKILLITMLGGTAIIMLGVIIIFLAFGNELLTQVLDKVTEYWDKLGGK